MNRSLRSIILAAAAFAAVSLASASPVGIASGNTTGTNWPMVEDIKKVCSTPASPINNVVSDGSLDNIFKITGSPDTQYGVIQEDALIFQQGRDAKMMSKVVVTFPFFSTEFHLVGKNGTPLRTLQDLQGKRVVEGPEGSGTWVTVQLIKALTGIKWTPILAGQQDGMNMVINGQADAEFIVAGSPVSVIQKAGTAVKLLSIQHPALDGYKYYTKTMIPTGVYPGTSTAVQTYKVKNVLATFAYKNQYQKEIGELVTCITHNLGTLQRGGSGFHPKWKDVDPLDIDAVAWPVHPAAAAAIKRELKAAK